MNSKEQLEKMNSLAPLFAACMRRVPPYAAAAFLGGFLANVVGCLPQDHWEQMLAEAPKPCGEPDCGCEKVIVPVMEALNLLREDWKEQTGS